MHDFEPFEHRRVISAGAAGLLLLLLFGLAQLQISSYQKRLVGDADRLLLRFQAVREYIVAAMLDNRLPDLVAAVDELEAVEEGLDRLLHDPVIPSSLRSRFVARDAFADLVLGLRQAAARGGARQAAVLHGELQSVEAELHRLHRDLAGRMAAKTRGFQALLVGVLLLLLLALAALVFLYHTRLYMPLCRLREQMPLAAAARKADNWRDDLFASLVAQRLEILPATMLGRLTSGFCHDIGQACNIIGNACQLAAEADDGELRSLLARIATANDRIADTVRLLCSLGGEMAAPARPFVVGQAVEEAGRLMRLASVAGRVEVRLDRLVASDRGKGSAGAFKLLLIALYLDLFGREEPAEVVLCCRRGAERRFRVALAGVAAGRKTAGEGEAADSGKGDADRPALAFCRVLAEAMGGMLSVFDSGDRGQWRVELLWPCAP